MKTSGTFDLAVDVEKSLEELEGVVFTDTLRECSGLTNWEQPSFSQAKTFAALHFLFDPGKKSVVVHSLRGCGDFTRNPFWSTTEFYSDGTWKELARIEK